MRERGNNVVCRLILSVATALLAAAARAAGGGDFLSIPVGGRPAALGGAYSALAADAYAPVWNPAGLGALTRTQVSAMHLDYAESIGYEFVSFAHPLGARDGIGAAASYLHPGRTAARDASGAQTGDFTAHDAAYTVAYGHSFADSLSLGAAFKIIDSRIDDVSARAYGGDIAALYRSGQGIAVSAVAANIGTKLRYINESDRLAETYRLGLLVSPLKSLCGVIEAGYERADRAFARFGAEWVPIAALALRAGYHSDGTRGLTGLSGLTAGVGLTAFGQRFDYAWVPMGDLGQTQYFSIVLTFGAGGAHE